MKTLVASASPDEPNHGSPFDAIKETDESGEYWSGRRLMPLMEYSQWRDFSTVIKKAQTSLALVQGEDAGQANFAEIRKVSGARGPAGSDYRLTRFGAYLTAMAGDDTKQAVAHARVYFAARTREAEAQAERPMTELQLAYRYIAVLEREQALAAANAQLTDKVTELSPKAESYDDLIAADGYMTLNAAAKALAPVTGGLGATRFINLLRGMAVLMQNSTSPYQNLIDRGYFAVRIDAATGSPYTAVTLKGLRWLQAELREDRPTLDHGNVRQLPNGNADGPEIAS